MAHSGWAQYSISKSSNTGGGGGCEDDEGSLGEAYEALKKTPYIKPYKFSIFLVVLALPFWIIGLVMALSDGLADDGEQPNGDGEFDNDGEPNQLADEDGEQPNQLADEILLVIGGALHLLAYFIIEVSGCCFLKSKWTNPTCCCCFLCYIRCCAIGLGSLSIVVIRVQWLNKEAAKDHAIRCCGGLLLLYFFILLLILYFLKIFYKEKIAGKEQPKENNQLELGEGITGKEQPKENNQQAPGQANRKVKPSDSLASKLQQLKQAKDQGLISEAEFQQCKSDLVSGIVGASKTV